MTSVRTVRPKNNISSSSSSKFGSLFDKSVRTVRTKNNIYNSSKLGTFSDSAGTHSSNKATMASLFGTTRENNNNCKTLFHEKESKVSSYKSGLSSFLINFHNRKKSKKKDHDANENNSRKTHCRKGFLSNKVTLPVSDTIANKKPEIESDAFGVKKSENGFKFDRKNSLNVTEKGFASWQSEAIILYESTSEYSDESFKTNSSTGSDHLPYFSLMDFQPTKVNLEIEEDVKEIISSEKGVQQNVEQPFEPQLPTKSMSFHKNTTPLKFRKGKYGACRSSDTGSFCIINTRSVSGPQEFQRESSQNFHVQPKVRKSYSSENKTSNDIETNNEEQGDNVLCKKKILMGRRCRPIDDDEFDYYKTQIPSKAANGSSSSHHDGNDKTKALPKPVNRPKSTSHDYGNLHRSNLYNFTAIRFQ